MKITPEIGLCTLHKITILKGNQLFSEKKFYDNSSCLYTLKGLKIDPRVEMLLKRS